MKTIKDLEITVTDFGSDSAIKVGSKTPLRLSSQALDFLATAICDLQDAEDVCLTQDEAVVSVKFSTKEGSLPTLFIQKDGRNVLVTRDIDELVAAIGKDRVERHVVANQVLDELNAKRNGHKVPTIPQILAESYDFPSPEVSNLPSTAELLKFQPDYTRADTDQEFAEFVEGICTVADNLRLACQTMLKALR